MDNDKIHQLITNSQSLGATHTNNTRYVHKLGITVCDDVIIKAVEYWGDKKCIPLRGSYVIRINNPIKCIFISFGYSGTMIPDGGICVTDGFSLSVPKSETFAAAELLQFLNPKYELCLRMQWMFIDLLVVDGKIIRSPTEQEIMTIKKRPNKCKKTDIEKYKTLRRITRRCDSKDGDVPDGKEDSDEERTNKMWDDLIKKDMEHDARQLALGNEPQTLKDARKTFKKSCQKAHIAVPSTATAPVRGTRGRGRPRGSRGAGRGSARSQLSQRNVSSHAQTYCHTEELPLFEPPLIQAEDLVTAPAAKKPRVTYAESELPQHIATIQQPGQSSVADVSSPGSISSFLMSDDGVSSSSDSDSDDGDVYNPKLYGDDED
jgi:hypothetical protein